MNLYLSLLISVLVTVGVYCLLLGNLMRIIIGVIILANAAHLILFVAGGLSNRATPIIPKGEEFLDITAQDPVPQALILTAIFIGFAVIAYFVILCREFYRERGEDTFTPRSFD